MKLMYLEHKVFPCRFTRNEADVLRTFTKSVAQSVEREFGEEAVGSIPAPYWLGRCQYNVIG